MSPISSFPVDIDASTTLHRYQTLLAISAPMPMPRKRSHRARPCKDLPLEQSLGLFSSDMSSITHRMLSNTPPKAQQPNFIGPNGQTIQRRALMPIQIGNGVAMRTLPPRVQRLPESPRKPKRRLHIAAKFSPSAKRLRPSSIRLGRQPLAGVGQPQLKAASIKPSRILVPLEFDHVWATPIFDTRRKIPVPEVILPSEPTDTFLSSFGAFRTAESVTSTHGLRVGSESFRVIIIEPKDRAPEEFSTASPMDGLVRHCVDTLRIEEGKPSPISGPPAVLQLKDAGARAVEVVEREDNWEAGLVEVGREVGLVRRATDSRVPRRRADDVLGPIYEALPTPALAGDVYLSVPSAKMSRPIRSASARSARKPVPRIDDTIQYPASQVKIPARTASYSIEKESLDPTIYGVYTVPKPKTRARALLARLAGKSHSNKGQQMYFPGHPVLDLPAFEIGSKKTAGSGHTHKSGGLKSLSVEAGLPRLKSVRNLFRRM